MTFGTCKLDTLHYIT